MNPLVSYFGPRDACEYFANYNAVSKSMLSTFRERRRLYESKYLLKELEDDEQTDSMRFGSFIHSVILEPHRLETDFLTIPTSLLAKNGAASTNAAKEFKAQAEAEGKTIIKPADVDKAKRILASVNNQIGDWLKMPSRREHVVEWLNEESGLKCKLRADWIIERADTTFCFDLKTCQNADPKRFQYAVEDYHYWLQQAHYTEGIGLATGKRVEFYFVAVETNPPYACSLCTLDSQSLSDAINGRRTLLRELAECLSTNQWEEPWERKISQLVLRPTATRIDPSIP